MNEQSLDDADAPRDPILKKIEERLHYFLDALDRASPSEAERWTNAILNLTKARAAGLSNTADPASLALQVLQKALDEDQTLTQTEQ